ncbi:hypothetical protein ACSRUE_31525 [Sorangium sp. KYC3313]|uniref:hypothetical protein n=1 Tax=Sorangium sp. KYC3313 TaxID=3449740 RepID=UPI003F8AE47E
MSKTRKASHPRARKTPVATASHAYALEQLYTDQDRDWVIDAIPAVLAWVPGTSKARSTQPFAFLVEHTVAGAPMQLVAIELRWNVASLQAQDATVADRAHRLRTGRTVQREHVTELAAYGLTFVAMSVLMPGTRIKHMRKGLPPDILFDVTPGAVRGVETAGRSTGGRSKLIEVRNGAPATTNPATSLGKLSQLKARSDVAEAHLSLWCASPRIAIMEQVKP